MPDAAMSNEALREKIAAVLDEKRRAHSLAVGKAAAALAAYWGLETEQAYRAGLLHDVARGMSGEELLTAALIYDLPVDEYIRNRPLLLHGPVGAVLLAEEWGISDDELLEAVRLHTVPEPDMSMLAKIVYLADIIEPTRRFWPGQAEIAALAREDLDAAMVKALEDTLTFLEDGGITPHPQTIEILNRFRMRIKQADQA